jgi:hypothetical protein
MHERGIVEDLIRHAESLCANRPGRALRVNLTVGALSGVDPRHISEYTSILATRSASSTPKRPPGSSNLWISRDRLEDRPRRRCEAGP